MNTCFNTRIQKGPTKTRELGDMAERGVLNLIEKSQQLEIGSIHAPEFLRYLKQDPVFKDLYESLLPLILDAGYFIFNDELADIVQDMSEEWFEKLKTEELSTGMPLLMLTLHEKNFTENLIPSRDFVSNIVFAKTCYHWSNATASEVFLATTNSLTASKIVATKLTNISNVPPPTTTQKFFDWYDCVSQRLSMKLEKLTLLNYVLYFGPEEACERWIGKEDDFSNIYCIIAEVTAMIDAETTAMEFLFVLTDLLVNTEKKKAKEEDISFQLISIVLCAMREKLSNGKSLTSWLSSLISILSFVRDDESQGKILFFTPFLGMKKTENSDTVADLIINLLQCICMDKHHQVFFSILVLLDTLAVPRNIEHQVTNIIGALLPLPSSTFQVIVNYFRSKCHMMS